MKLRVVLLLVNWTLLVGLAAIAGGPVSAQDSQAQPSAAERCFEHHRFGAEPVDVAKSADGQTVLAQVSWGYHDSIGCYLVLDDASLATLRAAATDDIDTTDTDIEDGTSNTDTTDSEMPQPGPQPTLLATGGVHPPPGQFVVGDEQSFEVAIEFTEAVIGFEAGDITVVNGDVTSFSGSGSEFRATVRASFQGSVVMWIGRDTVQDLSGNSNEPSQPLVAHVGQRTPSFFDTWDRDTVLGEFTVEFDRQEPYHGWTGDIDSCVAGTTSQRYRDSIFQRMNWYRQMAGVLPIVEDPELTSTAQAKALILAARGSLTHHPSPDWACYTQIDFFAESVSTASGLRGIDLYMRDHGSHNSAVGHRRMITDGRWELYGTGDIPGRANTLHARYSSVLREIREHRGFVAWPPSGYILTQWSGADGRSHCKTPTSPTPPSQWSTTTDRLTLRSSTTEIQIRTLFQRWSGRWAATPTRWLMLNRWTLTPATP